MRVDFQRKLDRFIGVPICRLLSLFHRRRKAVPGEVQPRKILIILLSEMGSLVLAQPMFKLISDKYPGASLSVLLFEKNRELLELIGVIPPDQIMGINDKSISRFILDVISIWTRLRKSKFDVVIDCELFARISSIISFLSGAPIRAGFHPHTQEGLYRGAFINRPVLYNPYYHISEQFVTLVDAIESDTSPKAKRLIENNDWEVPKFEPGSEEILAMKKRMEEDFNGIFDNRLVLIYPSGGILPIRAWPLDYFCRLASDLLEHGHNVGVIGIAGDENLAKTIRSHCQSERCIDLVGYTKSIRELLVLFHLASMLVTNDGGPGQFAALTTIPSIVFYGPETPVLYGPLDRKAVIMHIPLSCSPCLTAYNHRSSPCDGDNVCLKSIDPGQVTAKALEILKCSGEADPARLSEEHFRGQE